MPDIPQVASERFLHEDAVKITLDGYSLIELTGEDRLEWLQGQATNDVRGLTQGKHLSFCFCEPTGQLLAVVDAWAVEGRILMVVPLESADAMLERVDRMTILEDVAARLLSEEYEGVSVQGPKAAEALSQSCEFPVFDATMVVNVSTGRPTFVLRSDRTGKGGWDVWSPGKRMTVPLDELDGDALEAARIEAGIPKWGADMGPKTLPPELGPAFEARHVSYAKGCYTGQEVLMRMHSRGHTNKTWVGLVAANPLRVGDEVRLGEKIVGVLSSATASPHFGWLGAATLRNEATEEGTIVTVGGVEAEVRSMLILRQA